jgi:hypothetical protein
MRGNPTITIAKPIPNMNMLRKKAPGSDPQGQYVNGLLDPAYPPDATLLGLSRLRQNAHP